MFSSGGAVGFNDFRPRLLPHLGLEWTQTRTSVSLNIRVPEWVCKRHVKVNFAPSSIDVTVSGDDKTPLDLHRELFAHVDPDGCMWALEEDDHGCSLLLELEKDDVTFWARLFISDDPSTYVIVDPNATPPPTLESSVSAFVEDVCQKASGGEPSQQKVMKAADDNSSPVSGSTELQRNAPTTAAINEPATVVEDATDEDDTPVKPTADDADTELIEISDLPKANSETNGSFPSSVVSASSAQSSTPARVGSTNASDGVSTSTMTTTTPNGNLSMRAPIGARTPLGASPLLSLSPSGKRLVLNSIGLSLLIQQAVREPSGAVPSNLLIPREQLQALIRQHEETIRAGVSSANPLGEPITKDEYGEAAVQLGIFYHYGIGVALNPSLAERLYKIALDDVGVEDANAAFQLGLLYNMGAKDQVAIDYEKAVKYWTIAANNGSATGMFNLGVMLLNGNGCDPDPITAFALFHRANQLDPKLKPPALTKVQMDRCMEIAEKQKRVRERRNAPQHIKDQRKEEALKVIRRTAYSSLGLVGLGLSFFALRYWMRNRL